MVPKRGAAVVADVMMQCWRWWYSITAGFYRFAVTNTPAALHGDGKPALEKTTFKCGTSGKLSV